MKFITEDDLRLVYRNKPFTTYGQRPGERLTPGGRQFLSDHGIGICEYEETGRKGEDGAGGGSAAGAGAGNISGPGDIPVAQDSPAFGITPEIAAAIASAQALFLQAGSDLLDVDVLTAQEIFELERHLAGLLKEQADGGREWVSCSAITLANKSCCLEDCFEVTGFHAQSPRGRELVRLHRLRCGLRELAYILPEHKKESLYPIINRLSQMICLAFGGKTCQRKH